MRHTLLLGTRGTTYARPRRPGPRPLALAVIVLAAALLGARAGRPSASRADSSFNCGQFATTYAVISLNGQDATPGFGVRCVVWIYAGEADFYWYGEGRWGDFEYRHMGLGNIHNNPDHVVGLVSDLQGSANLLGLDMQFVNGYTDGKPNEINVEPWHEVWILQQSGLFEDYTPLPAATSCGPNFTQYTVADAGTPARAGSGIRCVMPTERIFPPNLLTVWYGTGTWDADTSYTHIGYWYPGRTTGQAVDLCGASFGTSCGTTGPRGLHFEQISPAGNGIFVVTGAGWNEIWQS